MNEEACLTKTSRMRYECCDLLIMNERYFVYIIFSYFYLKYYFIFYFFKYIKLMMNYISAPLKKAGYSLILIRYRMRNSYTANKGNKYPVNLTY